jgi:peroxiredoxin (alkyl hydroperoxide reductase subunit C)
MSLINQTVPAFTATAYHNGKFVPVTEQYFKGKWSVVVFYPADFTFVCPTELGDLADNYAEFRCLRSTACPHPTSPTRPGTTPPTPSRTQYPLVGDPAPAARFFQVLITEGETRSGAVRHPQTTQADQDHRGARQRVGRDVAKRCAA